MRSGNLKEQVVDVTTGALRPATDDDYKRAPASEGLTASDEEQAPSGGKEKQANARK